MADTVPSPYSSDPNTPNPNPNPLGSDLPTPDAPGFENTPEAPIDPIPEAAPPPPPVMMPEPEPAPPAPDPAPVTENLIAGAPTHEVNSFVPPPAAPLPDLTVPTPPAFPVNEPNPNEPEIMLRGEPTFPTMEAQNPGMTTATILPVGSSGTEMVSVPSSGGARRFIIPTIIGALIFLILVAGGIFFFQNQGNNVNNEAGNPTPTEEIASESAIPTDDTALPTPTTLPTTAYQNNEFAFTVEYPLNWVKAEGTLGNVVSFTDPSSGLAPTRISIRAESTTGDINTYVTGLKKLSAQLYTGWTNVSSTPTTVGTLTGTILENTYIKGTSTIHMLQLVVIKTGKAFTITAEAEDSIFETVKPSFSQSLASIVFN